MQRGHTKSDIPQLKAMGVSEVFRADTMLGDIVSYIRENVKRDKMAAV